MRSSRGSTLHPQIATVIKWFLERKSTVQISTNASLQSAEFWRELGEWSHASSRLEVSFAVDGVGDNNAVYRVGTDFDKIMANMEYYSETGGRGQWVFIEFDHNSQQKEEARKLAKSLNLNFFVRRSTRNIYGKTKAKKSPHPKAKAFQEIVHGKVKKWDPKSIFCKFIHGKEFFLACDGSVWPCCYLWDEYLKQGPFFQNVRDFCTQGENSIYQRDFSTIFGKDFYTSIPQMWLGESEKFNKRCYSSCGEKGLLVNNFSLIKVF